MSSRIFAMIAGGVSLLTLIGMLTAVNSYYAKAEELEQLKGYTTRSFAELELDRVRGRMNEISNIPNDIRKDWQIRELSRLSTLEGNILRRLEYDYRILNDSSFKVQ